MRWEVAAVAGRKLLTSPSVGLAGRARSGAVLGQRALLRCAAAGAAAEGEEEEEDEEESSVSPHALSCPPRHRVL